MSAGGVLAWMRLTTSDSANTVHWAFMGMDWVESSEARGEIVETHVEGAAHGFHERAGAGGALLVDGEVDDLAFGTQPDGPGFIGAHVDHGAGARAEGRGAAAVGGHLGGLLTGVGKGFASGAGGGDGDDGVPLDAADPARPPAGPARPTPRGRTRRPRRPSPPPRRPLSARRGRSLLPRRCPATIMLRSSAVS